MLPLRPIERVPAPSLEEFRERYVAPSRPVILTGTIDAWPARRAWNSDYLRSAFGDRMVPAIRNKPGAGQFDPRTGVHYEPVRMRDYVDAVEAGKTDLYMAFPVQDHLPELLDGVRR